MATKRIQKSTLSSFLRTSCDRELFLSLHAPSELEAAGMPVPLTARPGIGVLQTAGRDFEHERNVQLIQAFGGAAVYQPAATGTGQPAQEMLDLLIAKVQQAPSVLLQGKFEPSQFHDKFMSEIGLSAAQRQIIPTIAGLIPDIIVVRATRANDEEVLPNGQRGAIDVATEQRLALSIIDVKHTSEANPSYSAEVAFYALALANWLVERNLAGQYFVTTQCYLWTRFKQGESALDGLMSSGSSASANDYLDALLEDSEDANLRFYLPTVLRFFREDVVRVINTGDASASGWENLDWHVDSRCGACDWLGYDRWANQMDRQRIAAHPTHYCLGAAQLTGHLSRIAGMTRGARKTLRLNSIQDTAAVAVTPSTHQAFQEHSHLKKERSRIPAQAQALLSSTTTVDLSAVLATLAPAPNLHAVISVNFDASAGLLTGLSIQAQATTYTTGQAPRRFGITSFVVDQKSLDAEWVALEGLLSSFSDIVEQSEQFVGVTRPNQLTAQVAFWDHRQFEELCAAMGRHLPQVMSLSNRKTRALAWLFPADELLERNDGAVSPCIVFAEEIVRRVVFAPTPHVLTLFDVEEQYYAGNYPFRQNDVFYREFLTDGIPRERIYEIWSNAQVIRRGPVTIPRNTAIQRFANALDRQSQALNSVVERLRSDFRGQLKANAPRLDLSIPQGARNVAFDSRLWVWWEQLQFQTRKLEAHQQMALDGESLEGSYDAIRLTNGRPTGQPNQYEFDVLPGSTEAKFDGDESFLALGKDGHPGLPLFRARDLLAPQAPAYTGTESLLFSPLWSSLSLSLRSLDLTTLTAVLHISNYREPLFFPYLLANSTVDLMNDLFITKGPSSFKWYEFVRDILTEVGNPSIATPDTNAATAMGVTATAPGNDPISPLAQVLWDAPALNNASRIPNAEASAIADYARNHHGLNGSQVDAIIHAAERALTVIWGPPGTGKTRTLAGYVHGLVHDAAEKSTPLKILVAAPTYKAMEELIGRVVEALDLDQSCPADVFVAYSNSQTPATFTTAGAHLRVQSFNLDRSSQEVADCESSLSRSDCITIVATVTLQAYKFADFTDWSSASTGSVFDVAIIDESSQVQVTQAIAPIGTLKNDFRLVIAGDHLQMPPIMALEPPTGAEYLVGSIQQYLLLRPFSAGSVRSCPLLENYRSAEDIVSYARTIGYLPSLVSSNPQTSLHLLQPLPGPTSGFPNSLTWSPLWPEILDVDRKVLTLLHDDDLSSQSNLAEARMVASLVWGLRTTVSAELSGRGVVTHAPPTPQQFWESTIGIVTPHRAQRALVIRELRQIFPNDPLGLIEGAVDTVEKFQGGERHAIIVTFGVGDADVIIGEEAFLMQLERTNVAISRAMAKCVVIMPMTLASHVPQDKKALLTAHAIKQYVDEFCNSEVVSHIDLASGPREAKLRYHQ